MAGSTFMAGQRPISVQKSPSPKAIAKLRQVSNHLANTADIHPRFILTQQSLGELVTMSQNATIAPRIRSIGFAALLIDANRIPPPKTGFRQSYLDLQARIQAQNHFFRTRLPFDLIVQAFHNLAQYQTPIGLHVYDDTDEAGHFEKGLHFGAHYGPWGTDPGTP
ncbi:hypothetical protein KCU92_g1938, partial [Aureobasidium melanogenum]|jgi:hypothetical protein